MTKRQSRAGAPPVRAGEASAVITSRPGPSDAVAAGPPRACATAVRYTKGGFRRTRSRRAGSFRAAPDPSPAKPTSRAREGRALPSDQRAQFSDAPSRAPYGVRGGLCSRQVRRDLFTNASGGDDIGGLGGRSAAVKHGRVSVCAGDQWSSVTEYDRRLGVNRLGVRHRLRDRGLHLDHAVVSESSIATMLPDSYFGNERQSHEGRSRTGPSRAGQPERGEVDRPAVPPGRPNTICTIGRGGRHLRTPPVRVHRQRSSARGAMLSGRAAGDLIAVAQARRIGRSECRRSSPLTPRWLSGHTLPSDPSAMMCRRRET